MDHFNQFEDTYAIDNLCLCQFYKQRSHDVVQRWWWLQCLYFAVTILRMESCSIGEIWTRQKLSRAAKMLATLHCLSLLSRVFVVPDQVVAAFVLSEGGALPPYGHGVYPISQIGSCQMYSVFQCCCLEPLKCLRPRSSHPLRQTLIKGKIRCGEWVQIIIICVYWCEMYVLIKESPVCLFSVRV